MSKAPSPAGALPRSPPRRGRPRSYDPDAALEAALGVFWSQGFAATSLDELSEATGMARPSLYAAFGDKRGIFDKAVTRFLGRMRRELGGALVAPQLESALVAFYSAALGIYTESKVAPGGCLVFCVAVLEAPHDETVRAHVASALADLDGALATRFRQAAQDGEIACDADVKLLGSMATALLHSLSIRARAGGRPAALRKWIKASVKMLVAAAR